MDGKEKQDGRDRALERYNLIAPLPAGRCQAATAPGSPGIIRDRAQDSGGHRRRGPFTGQRDAGGIQILTQFSL